MTRPSLPALFAVAAALGASPAPSMGEPPPIDRTVPGRLETATFALG